MYSRYTYRFHPGVFVLVILNLLLYNWIYIMYLGELFTQITCLYLYIIHIILFVLTHSFSTVHWKKLGIPWAGRLWSRETEARYCASCWSRMNWCLNKVYHDFLPVGQDVASWWETRVKEKISRKLGGGQANLTETGLVRHSGGQASSLHGIWEYADSFGWNSLSVLSNSMTVRWQRFSMFFLSGPSSRLQFSPGMFLCLHGCLPRTAESSKEVSTVLGRVKDLEARPWAAFQLITTVRITWALWHFQIDFASIHNGLSNSIAIQNLKIDSTDYKYFISSSRLQQGKA